MRSTNRRTRQCSSALALSVFGMVAAGSAAAGDRWDYWDPRASIPARVIDTHLGVVALAATIAGDYRTAAVFDHLSGRFPAPVPVPVVQHVYYPPPVVEHVHYAPPRPVVLHHVHKSGCGHSGHGFDRGHGRRHDRGYAQGHGRGRGNRGGWDRDDRWDDDDRGYGRRGHGGYGRRDD